MSRTRWASGLRQTCSLITPALALLIGLAPASARADSVDVDRTLLSSTQLQDFGARLRPQQRRGNTALASGLPLQVAALSPKLGGSALPTPVPEPIPPVALAAAPVAAASTATAPAPPPALAAVSTQLLAATAPRSPVANVAPEPRFDLTINNAPAARC